MYLGASPDVILTKLVSQISTSDFESHWVLHSFGLVSHRSKKLHKLLHQWLQVSMGAPPHLYGLVSHLSKLLNMKCYANCFEPVWDSMMQEIIKIEWVNLKVRIEKTSISSLFLALRHICTYSFLYNILFYSLLSIRTGANHWKK